MKLINTYNKLPELFYTYTKAKKVRKPQMVIFNDDLARALALDQSLDYTTLLSGNGLSEAKTLAQAYAGHQYGHFTMLGDGRALLLGELETPKGLVDIQLKGSGPTKYSRRGDGLATLRSMLREYLISEAMYHLNVATTRSLAVVTTGEPVYREMPNEGAVLTRIASSHVRVGTFQYAASHGPEYVKALADHIIQRLYPNLKDASQPYASLLEAIMIRQAHLIAQWQGIGFIHGVMNTDNMAISGETIDYGPCAFMDVYHPKTVFSSIDHQGRYAYDQQANIGLWNLARLGECFLTLLNPETDKALDLANQILSGYQTHYHAAWLDVFSKKIGLKSTTEGIEPTVMDLLAIMFEEGLDFTNTFMQLSNPAYEGSPAMNAWLRKWRLEKPDYELMKSVNPFVIPRNHQVEQALQDAEAGNFKTFEALLSVVKSPFQPCPLKYTLPPTPSERVMKTYCGT